MIQVFFLNFTQTFLSHPRTAAGFNQYTQSLKFKAFLWVLMPQRIWIVSYAWCCGLYNFLSHKQQVYRWVVWCIFLPVINEAQIPPAASDCLRKNLLKNFSMCCIWPKGYQRGILQSIKCKC